MFSFRTTSLLEQPDLVLKRGKLGVLCNQTAWDPERGEYLFETIAKRWAAYGYNLPRVIFWNLDARQENIPALGGRFSYVSGFSMNMVETILSGKDGYDLMMAKLNTDRYSIIK